MGICSYLLSLLIFIGSAQLMHHAEGRPLPKYPEVTPKYIGGGGGGMVDSTMIGSRPPRCERRCVSCGRCEAVQVPVSPNNDRKGTSRHAVSKRSKINGVASISDDTSNYKPMSWKCKCGERILNP